MRIPTTSARPRVLILPSWYPTERYPMGGVFCQEQARALIADGGCDPLVLFIDRVPLTHWHRLKSRRPSLQREEGVRVYRAVMPRVPGVWPFLYPLWVISGLRALRRRYGYKPDLIHAHVSLPAGLAGAIVSRFSRTKLVITEHTGPFSMLMRNRPAALATGFALRSADKVIAVSSALREQILAYPQLRREISVLPNVVDTEAFLPSADDAPKRVGPPRILFAGEMDTSIKGVDYLLGALALLRREGTDFRADLIGEGRNRREYEALARSLGVADRCRFHGSVPHSQVAAMMRDSDLFVLASLAETFGVVLVEALASGVPVVATRCGGPEEIVTPEAGILVEPANSAALASAIADVLGKPQFFNPWKLREVAVSRYGQRSIGGALVQIYKQLVGAS